MKRKYNKSQFQDIDFSVREGEFLGIMEASVGKTTMLNRISTIDTVKCRK